MPTYEYECGRCGHRFERLQGMSEAPIRECPECGGSVRRLIGTGIGILSGRSRSGREDPHRGRRSGCAFETSGRTCCGRDERCGSPRCEGEG